jgi:hypothetical protein
MTMRRQALRSSVPLATSVFLSLILVFFFTLPSIPVRAEPVSSGTISAEADRVTPGDMNTGALLLQTEDGALVEAPRLQTDVVMTVTGAIARVTVTQRFENIVQAKQSLLFALNRLRATQHAMKAAGRPASYDRARMQDPSGAGMLNSLMPSAAPQLAFDGGAVAATESAPADIDTAPPVPDPAQRPDPVTAAPAGPDVGQANYPLLPLTVVPKPEANPLAALKAPHDANQRIAILALVLALLSAVTFILWRYHRRDYASPRRIGRRI